MSDLCLANLRKFQTSVKKFYYGLYEFEFEFKIVNIQQLSFLFEIIICIFKTMSAIQKTFY